MGYYMRFIMTGIQPVLLTDIESALQQIDARYVLIRPEFDETRADLHYGSDVLGEIEINSTGDDIFDEDITDLKDLVENHDTPEERRVIEALSSANQIIAISALWEGRNSEPTLEKLDPLWDWLFAHYAGLLQADNDGFYDAEGLILEANLKI